MILLDYNIFIDKDQVDYPDESGFIITTAVQESLRDGSVHSCKKLFWSGIKKKQLSLHAI